jgi:hypothetical protein
MRRTLLPPLLSTRSVVLFGAMLIALALIVLALVGASAKPADAATRVVTKTFSNAQQINIPSGGAAAPYPSERSVQGFNQGTVLDVNLSLKNFSHTFPDDVDVLLAKKGTTRTVMSDVGGGSSVNNITLNLDDESLNGFLPDNGPLVGGKFKPTNAEGLDFFPDPTPTPSAQSALSGFDGINPNGVWKVRVVDDLGGFSGAFAGGWSITIKARVQT